MVILNKRRADEHKHNLIRVVIKFLLKLWQRNQISGSISKPRIQITKFNLFIQNLKKVKASGKETQ
jgi:hypothetical protein